MVEQSYGSGVMFANQVLSNLATEDLVSPLGGNGEYHEAANENFMYME